MGTDEFREIGDMILALLGSARGGAVSTRTAASICEGVVKLTRQFPFLTDPVTTIGSGSVSEVAGTRWITSALVSWIGVI